MAPKSKNLQDGGPGFGISKQESVKLIVQTALEEGINNPKQIAYMLATAQHESADFKSPEEHLGRQQATRLKYHGGSNYFGRGYVHLTHIENYQDMDRRLGLNGALNENPDLATEPHIAARILVIGMKEGRFTGKKIGRYINDDKTDYINARRVVNGTDKAVEISKKAEEWEKQVPELIKEIQQENSKHQCTKSDDPEFHKKESSSNDKSYDKIMEMIQGLSNDKDGSFAKKLLEENQDVVAAFEAKIENITQQNNVEQTQKELNMEQSKGGRSL